jgi:uncharacterized membrane protein YidH (DUF202 family)
VSIVTALFALGLALTIAAGITTFLAIINYLTMLECGDREERQRAGRFLVTAVSVLCIGVFLIGLTAQEATA